MHIIVKANTSCQNQDRLLLITAVTTLLLLYPNMRGNLQLAVLGLCC